MGFFTFLITLVSAVFTVSSMENNCTSKIVVFYSQSYVECELNNIKFDDLESFNINVNKTELLIATGHEVMNETVISGLILEGVEEPAVNVSFIEVDDLITKVKFKSSKVSTITSEIFHKFKMLQIFDASDTQVKKLTSLSFNNAANLLMIFLYKNQLTAITSYTFVHTKKLKNLDLSNNRISNINIQAFNSLANLEKLSLSNNRLKSLEISIFLPLRNLEWVWLDDNSISSMNSDFFTSENKNLLGIFIKNNAVHTISPYMFDNLSTLRFLDMRGNKCTGKTFINVKIQDNASVKFELHECHQNHRKLNLSSDLQHNLSHKFNTISKSIQQCLVEVTDLIMKIDKVEKQVESFTSK